MEFGVSFRCDTELSIFREFPNQVDYSELSSRIKNGDRAAFEMLFHAMYGQLCAYAERFLQNPDDAEELVQDTFVKIWQRREKLDITFSIKSYLYQSVRNASLNIIKHNNVVREHQAYHNATTIAYDESDAVVTLELEERIRKAVNQLPEERRKIFQMSRDEGMKYQQIADELGISIKTVENQIGRALKQMRGELSDYFVCLLLLNAILEININAGWG